MVQNSLLQVNKRKQAMMLLRSQKEKRKGMHILQSASSYESLGSLSNDDGDDNKNGKKEIGLNKQNN